MPWNVPRQVASDKSCDRLLRGEVGRRRKEQQLVGVDDGVLDLGILGPNERQHLLDAVRGSFDLEAVRNHKEIDGLLHVGGGLAAKQLRKHCGRHPTQRRGASVTKVLS